MSYMPTLNKLQIGVEAVLMDEGVDTIEPVGITNVRITPKVEAIQIPDKRGDTMPAWLSMVTKRWSEGTIEGYLDYERFQTFLDTMFNADATSPHAYKADLDWSGAAEKSLSLRYGQTGLLNLVGGVLPTELIVTGESGGLLQYTYNFFGGDVSDGATFAALTVDTPDFAQALTTIYIDEGLGATIGTTALADTAFKFSWKVSANRAPVWHLGELVYDSYKRGKWTGQLDLTLEGTAVALGHFGDQLDATATPKSYCVRLRTTDAANTLDLDFVGTVIGVANVATDLDGVVTVEMSLAPQYGTVYASCFGATLTIA